MIVVKCGQAEVFAGAVLLSRLLLSHHEENNSQEELCCDWNSVLVERLVEILYFNFREFWSVLMTR